MQFSLLFLRKANLRSSSFHFTPWWGGTFQRRKREIIRAIPFSFLFFFFFFKDDLLTSSPPPQPIFATGPKNASKVERKSERTKKKPPSLPLFSLSEKIPTILSRKKREVEEKRPNFSAKRAQGEGRGGGFCLPILRKTLFFLLLLLSLRPSPPPPSFPPLLNTKSLSRPQRGGRGEEKEREKGP